MSKSVASVAAEEYARVRESPFPRVHGRPAWTDYHELKKTCRGSGTGIGRRIHWATGPTGTPYGLMGEVLGAVEYEDITSIAQAEYDGTMSKPSMYDTSITAATSDYQRDNGGFCLP